VLIVTRDVWSLRFNEDFEARENQLIYFTGSLSENNLFGWRKYLAAVFVTGPSEMAFDPVYRSQHPGHAPSAASGYP